MQGNTICLGALLAKGKTYLEVHELSIGGKAAPARLVFNVASGKAINASLINMGNRFRLIVIEVEAIEVEHALPKLPVARALWKPLPDMNTACTAWIYAGDTYHTVYSHV